MNRKSSTLAEFISEKFDVRFTRREKLDLSRVQQLPTYRYVIERYLTVSNEFPSNLKNKKDKAITELTKELVEIWVFMNIPPKTFTNCRNDIKGLIQLFSKLLHTAISKRKDKWLSETLSMIKNLDRGFDMKEKKSRTENEYLEMYGVAPGLEEDMMYADNCRN